MNLRSGTLAVITVGLACVLLGTPSLDAQDSRPKGKAEETGATRVDLQTFSFPLDPAWKQTKPDSSMRLAQASLPGPNEETAAAELVVFHFPGSGGSVSANLDRWKGQFGKPEGVTEEEFAKERKTTADTLPITILDVHGSFAGGGMGRQPAPSIADAKMFAVIIETSEGPYFIKVTGPAATIEHHRKALEAVVTGIKRGAKEPEGKAKPTSQPGG